MRRAILPFNAALRLKSERFDLCLRGFAQRLRELRNGKDGSLCTLLRSARAEQDKQRVYRAYK